MAITDGMSTADMQSRLAALQAAYFDLSAGAKVVTASYSQGDGSKSVTYRQSDLSDIRNAIYMLQMALDPTLCNPRRARRIRF